jgi:diapolycopene oxygenase
MARTLPVGVIGAGLGGLSAAVTLAARGFDVSLFEKNAWLGGKAATLKEDGFCFDMGPTILTVPEVLRRIFGEAGRNLDDELDLVRLNPQWRCFFDDGSVLDLVEDVNHMAQKLKRFAPASNASAGYRNFIALSERLHDVADRFFFWKPVEDIRDTVDIRRHMNPSTLADVISLRMGATVAGTIRRRVDDPRVAQMLDHFIQ